MDVTGNIIKIGEIQTLGQNGFTKRELVIETKEQYPQKILIEFVKDKCELLNKYGEGQEVTVSVNLRGREWSSPQGEIKYFNTIQGWKIEGDAIPQKPTPKPKPEPEPEPEDHDDLPF